MAAARADDDEPLPPPPPPPPTASRRRPQPGAVRRCPASMLAVAAATLVAVAGVLVRPVTATRCDEVLGTGVDDDWYPPTSVELVLAAQTVIYGRVRRTIPDPEFSFYNGRPIVYTASMEVYCTLKGRRLDRVVNLSRAGAPSPRESAAGLSISTGDLGL